MDSCSVHVRVLNASTPPGAKVPSASLQSKLVRVEFFLSVAVWTTRTKSFSSASQLRPTTRLFNAAPRTGATAIPPGNIWCLCYHQVLYVYKGIGLSCSSFPYYKCFSPISNYTYLFFTFTHSPRRWASSISCGDISSLRTWPSGRSGSAVCSICAGLQKAPSWTSAETAGVWRWAGSHRRSHHFQCRRQHFSGKSNRDNHEKGFGQSKKKAHLTLCVLFQPLSIGIFFTLN